MFCFGRYLPLHVFVCSCMYLLMSSMCAKTVVALQEHLQIELDTTIFGDIQILCIIKCNY